MMKAKHLSGSGFWWRGQFANVIRRPSRRPFSDTVRGVQTLLKEWKSFQLVWPKKIKFCRTITGCLKRSFSPLNTLIPLVLFFFLFPSPPGTWLCFFPLAALEKCYRLPHSRYPDRRISQVRQRQRKPLFFLSLLLFFFEFEYQTRGPLKSELVISPWWSASDAPFGNAACPKRQQAHWSSYSLCLKYKGVAVRHGNIPKKD